ncbi:alcohol acyltransferase 9-like [Silene latifolia]|uniref:alcohol acyltransferase 9-like n=1 Tax=Silene latifolia TaxID=37657 RepID=UPI003D7742F9
MSNSHPKQNQSRNKKMENNKYFKIKESTVIIPSDPTPDCILSLSTLDSQLIIRFVVEYLLVYNTPPGIDRSQFSTRIKSALSRALIQYYPLSGRVSESPGRTLQVDCRAQGVVFVEAESEYKLSDFEWAPRHVEEWRPLMWVHEDDVLKGAPILVVQLTWLADGAVAVGFGFNHTVCDGFGAAAFINSFADLTRGLNFIGPKPVWERHLLDPAPIVESDIGVSRVDLDHSEFSPVTDCCGFIDRFSSEQLIPTSIVFDKAQINELKKKASVTTKFTSFDVISAHIWRCWARSLQFPPNQTLKLLFSVNFRNRVKSGLPSGFYGNGFVLGCAQTTAKDLTEKGLGYASELIRKAKERVDDKYVREIIELVNGNKRSPDLVGVLILTQWTRLGLERADFGLGKLAHVVPICCGNYCLLLPVLNQKEEVRVMMGIPCTAVDNYHQQLYQVFLKTEYSVYK